MYLTNYEKETIILYNDAEEKAEVYTCNKSLISKLDKLCEKNPMMARVKEEPHSKTYTFPKKWVRIQAPPTYTDETRKKMALRAKANLHKKQSEGIDNG